MSYLPHTDGVLVPSPQNGISLQVLDQEMHDPSRQWYLRGHGLPEKQIFNLSRANVITAEKHSKEMEFFFIIADQT